MIKEKLGENKRMGEKEFLSALNDFIIPEISEDTKFWMIRTKKGCFYDEFISKRFVAIGWNFIDKKTDKSESNQETLKSYLEEKYGEKRPQMAINKCIKFISEIEEGDIIIIPNKGTKKITFAKAGGYYEEHFSEEEELRVIEAIEDREWEVKQIECPYNKRRRIEILKTVSVSEVNIHLYMALTNYHGLSSMQEYAKMILDSIYPLYIYNNICSLQIGINNKNEINANAISLLVAGVTGCLKGVSGEEDIYATMNLNSPGKISCWFSKEGKQDSNGKNVFDALKNGKSKAMLLLLIVAITGGQAKVGSVELSLPGIVKTIEDVKTIDTNVKKKKIEVKKLEIDNFEEKYDIYKKLKDDNIDINEFKNDLDKIIRAGEDLNLGFNKLTDN